jgi:hypothetical protein
MPLYSEISTDFALGLMRTAQLTFSPVCCALAFERRALQSTRCITRAMKLILYYFWIVIFPLIVKVPVHGMTDVRIGVGPVSELFCPH